jgi:hypothetical protein
MQHRTGATPADALWTDFLSYKYINDPLFEREMIVVTLLLYKKMLLLSLDQVDTARELSDRIDTYLATLSHKQEIVSEHALNALLTEISRVPWVTAPVNGESIHDLLLGHSAWSDFYPDAMYTMQATVGTLVHVLDAPTPEPTRLVVSNTLRLYHIQRMLKALFVLSHHAKMPIYFSSPWSEKIKTPIVRDCVARMESSHDLLPLFQVWQRIICYDFINDIDEVKEFMQVLIVVYKNLICCLHKRFARPAFSDSDVQLHDLLAVYDQINVLEISELLDLLDDVALQLDHISHLYELDNPHLSWTRWFKKYWWVLPVCATWLYVALLKQSGENVLYTHEVA